MKISNLKGIFKFILIISLLFNSGFAFSQFTIPEKPSFQTSVYDYANVLSATEKKQLEEKLVRYSDSTTTQIVVITIEDLKGEDIGVLATNWGHKWGIGQKDEDNGITILVAKNDRKISIRPGYGVEDRLTAGTCGEIIRNVITPEFKAGSYFNGLDKGADTIFEALKGKYKGERKGGKSPGGGKIIFFIILFIIIIAILSRNKRGGGGGNTGRFAGPDLGDIIILSSLGRGGFGGFGGGSSSGGGFGGGGFGGGFGGGGFSGGGASGSW
ncbi:MULTISPECIES: TPM domain-containing protein [Flavobacterium]|uniref:TPM domain-containing protein n=1 Tax=Flavobacterium TaxID=237 RepID=UPI001FCBFADC|nr:MULTISPECIES: TPM domain-containing protein [Flavobacterium]UOK42629.1 TPM domain-containing protein [Flavobacterium enshiense]